MAPVVSPLFDMTKAEPITAPTPNSAPLFDMSKAQPIEQPTQQPEQPGFGQRAYESSGLKSIVETAKQKWQESQLEAQKEQEMIDSAMQSLKTRNYGQATEILLQHLAEKAKQGGMMTMGAGPSLVGSARDMLQSSAESIAKHTLKGVKAAKSGAYGTAALEGAGILGGGSEDTDRILEDIENENISGLAGDVTGGGIKAAAMLLGPKVLGGESAEAGEVTQRLRSYRTAEGAEAATRAKVLNPVEATTAKNVAKAKLPAGENLAEEAQAHLEESTAGEINRIADSNRVSRPKPGPAHEMQRDVADSIYNRSKAEYAEVDARTSGKFQPNADKLANVNKKLRDIAGTDEEKEAELEATKTKLLWQQDKIFEEAEKNGLSRETVDKARNDFHTAQAQYDLSNNLRASALSDNPNALDATKMRNRMNKMNITEEGGKPGRLTQAVGKESATNLEQNAHAVQFMSQLPPTEARALTEMVGSHTKTSLLRGATTDWKGVMEDFDALKPAEQKARFANPEAVRNFIRNQGRLVWAKRAAIGAGATAVGGGIWHEGSRLAP